MNWTQVKPWEDSETLYWIAGIYKCSTYDGKHFHAYFIQDHYNNWGDSPSQAPLTDSYYHSRFWPSLEAAQQACEEHAKRYIPKPHIVKRAQELLESFLTPA